MNTKVNEGKLISGLDIPRLVRDEVGFQFRAPPNGSYQGGNWIDFRLDEHEEEFTIGDLINLRYEFRLKPRTITINGIEVPAPFEPKEGEMYFYLNPHAHAGYGPNTTIGWSKYLQFGVWRTEEEIKQVVAALRQVFGGSHDN